MLAIAPQGRHIFWHAPAAVWPAGRGYPVVNRFLGQFGMPTFRFPRIDVSVVQSFMEQRFREVVAGAREPDATAAANLDLALKTWLAFPFPPPKGLFSTFWLERAGGDLTEPVFSGRSLIADELRIALALSTLDHYDEVMADIEAHEKSRARKKKRRALIKKIVTGIVGTVIGIIVPIAGAVWAVGETALSEKERRDAAKDIEKAAKQFDAEDAAFAAELRRAAQVLDYQAQQTAAAAGLSPEEAEAIAETDEEAAVPGEEPPTEPAAGPSTELLVGGGLAAAAAVALAFFA